MEFLIPIVLALLLVSGFVTWMVLNATRKGGSNAEGGGQPGIGRDETPLGYTSEHAGEQSREGVTVGPVDAERAGGTGRPPRSYAGTGEAGGRRASGEPGDREDDSRASGDDGEPRSDSERLANRRR